MSLTNKVREKFELGVSTCEFPLNKCKRYSTTKTALMPAIL